MGEKMSFFLMLLQFTAVTGQYVSFTVKDGEDVTLPCNNVRNNQDKCSRTTWILSTSRTSGPVELILYGKISENAKVKSDRLSLTENCSLVIKKVTDEDGGLYMCQQSGSGTDQFYLFVVTMTEHQVSNTVTLSCSVTHPECRQTVKWLFEGEDEEKQNLQLRTSQSHCSATVTFLTSSTEKSKSDKLFKCEVTEIHSSQVQQFPFNHQTSGDKQGDGAKEATTSTAGKQPPTTSTAEKQPPTTSTAGKQPTTSPAPSNPTTVNPTITPTLPTKRSETSSSPASVGWWGFSIVALVLAVAAVMIIRWKKTKVTKTQVDENTTDAGDGVSYATVSFTKKTNSEAQGHANDGDDEGEAVTYSKLKAPSSCAGASTDPNMLYATVIKHDK